MSGAILRTAAAFAVEAIVVTERHSPQFSGVLAKAASGGLEHVEIVSVVNLARAMEELADHNYTILGLDSEGADTLETVPLQAPVALALGAEGKGLRRLTRERCAAVARLDTPGAIKSLNVSNACAVALSVMKAEAGLKRKKAPPAQGPAGRTQNAKPKLPHRALQPGRDAVAQKIERRGADAAE